MDIMLANFFMPVFACLCLSVSVRLATPPSHLSLIFIINMAAPSSIAQVCDIFYCIDRCLYIRYLREIVDIVVI